MVLLLAVRVFAWAGGTDPLIPAATTMIDSTIQASTTHADLVHVRIVLSLSFLGNQRRTLLGPDAESKNRPGKERI